MDYQTVEDDADDSMCIPRPRKSKRRLVQLLNLRPTTWYRTAAVIGPPDSPTYIMEVEVDGQTFQGISQSKKKAKVMAAEYALMYLGEIDSVTESPPPPVFIPQPCSADDFSSDVVFPTKIKSSLLRDFSLPEDYVADDQHDREIVPEMSSNKPTVDSRDDDLPEELRGWGEDDLLSQLIGKNPLTIIGEMQIDASYMLLAKSDDPLHPMFAVAAVVDGETFRAAGNSKKLAKARAARDALRKLYNLEFGISENGMPIYEGDDRIWQHYKAKLEREAVIQLRPQNNPMILIMEYFPDVQIVEGPVLDGSVFFSASVSVFDEVYSGVGVTKLEAKINAAAYAVDVLQRNGVITAREKELKAEQREANWLKRHAEGPPEIPRYDHRMFAVQKNAAAKLNVIYHNLEFMELRETRIPRADLIAFIIAVVVEDRTYVGVGKTKKEARCEAAEKALRYLQLWTDADEENKRMMLYGIDEEDPVEMVMRLRAEAGLPPYLEEWDTPVDHSLASSWDSGPVPGGWDDGHSHIRGPPPSRFHGPDFRPPMFPPCGMFDNGHRGPRPAGPPHQVPFGRGYNGERPNDGFGRDRPTRGGPIRSYDRVGPIQADFGRSHDTGPASRPPRGRGNTSMTRGISRGQLSSRGSLSQMVTVANKKVPPAPGPDRVHRFDVPNQGRVEHASHAVAQRQDKPVFSGNKAGTVPVRPKNSNITGQLPFSANVAATRNTTPRTNPATTFNYAAVAGPASNALRTSVPACSPWNPVSISQSYGQQPNTTVSTQIYPNTAVSTTIASGIASSGEQHNMNTWPAGTQADYFAYYNSYLQSMGVSDTHGYINMPVSNAASTSLAPSSAVQTDADYASQVMAYANSTAAYYNTFYAAGGYADPSQSQLYNYMYPYSNKPT